jgi:phosphatidylglycerophosphate synthase
VEVNSIPTVSPNGRTGAAGMSVPAVIFCEPATAALRIAALTVLDRLLVAVHRVGCRPIYVVCPGQLPDVKRARAWQIEFRQVAAPPALEGPALVATTGVLFTRADAERLLASGGHLHAADGTPLPAGLVPRFTADWRRDLESLPPLRAGDVAWAITDVASARAAERALWQSLTSSADGFVDRHFNRPAGRALSKLLVHTPVTPNQISLLATLVGVVSAACFAVGGWRAAVLGAVLLQLSAIIDCVDGDVARAVFKESPLGRWLDIVGDQVVHVGVFVALGVGLCRAGTEAPVLWLAASAGIGVVLSFLVVLRGLLRPGLQKNTALQRLIDATTNRDFSVLLLVLAAVDRLEWFLWLAAIGVHVFWAVALSLQLRRPEPLA